jgi:hypothetical protein
MIARDTSPESPKGGRCMILFLLLLVLAILYYYLDDYLDEGRSFFALDSYGRGLLTWWWMMEWFWGSFVLASIKAFIIAGYLVYYLPPEITPVSTKARNKVFAGWLGIVLIAVICGFIFGGLPTSPLSYNIGELVIFGWYPEFMARHLIDLTFVASGLWLIPILIFARSRGWQSRRWNPYSAIFLGIGTLLLFVEIIKGEWSLNWMFSVVYAIEGALGLFFIVLPVVCWRLSLSLRIKSPELKSSNIRIWDFIFWMGLVVGYGIFFFTGLFGELDTGIEISSHFIPQSFWSNLYIGMTVLLLISFSYRPGGQNNA